MVDTGETLSLSTSSILFKINLALIVSVIVICWSVHVVYLVVEDRFGKAHAQRDMNKDKSAHDYVGRCPLLQTSDVAHVDTLPAEQSNGEPASTDNIQSSTTNPPPICASESDCPDVVQEGAFPDDNMQHFSPGNTYQTEVKPAPKPGNVPIVRGDEKDRGVLFITKTVENIRISYPPDYISEVSMPHSILQNSKQFKRADSTPAENEDGSGLSTSQCDVHEPSPIPLPVQELMEKEALNFRYKHGYYSPRPPPVLPGDLFYQNKDGDTQLHVAIINLDIDKALMIVRKVRNVSDLNIPNRLGQTALHLAVHVEAADLTRFLICSGSYPEARDRQGDTPLHIACRSANMACARALVTPVTAEEISHLQYPLPFYRIPQDQSVLNYAGFACLHLAAFAYRMDLFSFLVNTCGADVNMRDGTTGSSVLHIAAVENRQQILQYLLIYHMNSLDLNARRYDGYTAIEIAVANGYRDIAHILRQSGAKYDVTCKPEPMEFEEEDKQYVEKVSKWLSGLKLHKQQHS